ncbi:MAG: hypothetical protein QG623_723, partial [Patescibacteria group bacterium]|nr:hypothetical protein [Patescibacteria group bacterium]
MNQSTFRESVEKIASDFMTAGTTRYLSELVEAITLAHEEEVKKARREAILDIYELYSAKDFENADRAGSALGEIDIFISDY